MGISGRSARKKAKREAAWQAEQNAKQQREMAAQKKRFDNVMQASASLDQQSMFDAFEEGLGITGAEGEAMVAGELAGTRKRRKKQDTGGGLGIM